MISYYRINRLTAIIGSIAAGPATAAAVFFLLARQLPSIGSRLLAAVLAAFVAVNIVLFVARMLALRYSQTDLLLLYEKLDPQAFLEKVLPLANIKTDASTHCTTMVHIANGYLYSGDFAKAIETLQAIETPEKAIEARGLVMSNLAACRLAAGHLDQAQLAMTKLNALASDKNCKKEFSLKARHSLGYLQICMDIARGKHKGGEALEKDFAQTNAPLHKVEVQFWLAKLYLHTGDREKLAKAAAYVTEHGGKLYMAREIKKMTLDA